MRLLLAVLIGVVLLSAVTNPDRADPPTVAADMVTIKEVQLGSLVQRPAGAKDGAQSSLFVVDKIEKDGLLLRRVPIQYGPGSTSLIKITSGVAMGDRVVVSDMRAWEQFDRLRVRPR
jgi:HlyD family secretion protein